MSFILPTTRQIQEINLSNYELRLAQDSPLQDKAFLRVKSANEAFTFTTLYKFAAERALQNLIATATGVDLDNIGRQYFVNRNNPQVAIIAVEITGSDGSMIQTIRSFVGSLNGLRYTIQNSAEITSGVASLILTASQSGVAGNLQVGSSLTVDSPVPGINSVATVTSVNQLGTNQELDDDYRVRISDVVRSSGGGGNSSDYREWAQEVPGVRRAYPFSGKPISLLAESFPPERTVYVQSTSDISPDGIPPQALLDSVRQSISIDPEDGTSRQPLGLTDETLFVEPITRTGFFVTVRDVQSTPGLENQIRQNIASSLDIYFRSLESFVQGLDPLFSRNDLITDLIISDVVQDVLRSEGASASSVGFGLSRGSFVSSYRLAQGELASFIQVDFE